MEKDEIQKELTKKSLNKSFYTKNNTSFIYKIIKIHTEEKGNNNREVDLLNNQGEKFTRCNNTSSILNYIADGSYILLKTSINEKNI